MDTKDSEKRLAQLEAIVTTSVQNISMSISEINGKLTTSTEQRTQMIASLAVITSKQQDEKEYREKCDTERTSMRKDIDKALTYQKYQRHMAAVIAGVVAWCVTDGAAALRRLGAFFS